MNSPYSEGPLDAKICFIGEAPGADEVRAGRPFVGDAGKVLDRLLSRAGIVRSSCRIENVVQERPPSNDISYFISLDKKQPYITPKGQQYINELLERLAACSANVFVPLGNAPLWVLTGMKEITKRRGSILKAVRPAVVNRKVIPTIHPAAALRQYTFQHFIAYDLRRVAAESTTPDVHWLDRHLLLDPSFDAARAYIAACNKCTHVGFDIEVFNNEISHVSLSMAPDDAICIPFYDAGKEYFNPDQEFIIWKELKELLENPKVIKIGQNITFDNTFVFTRYGIIVRPIEDTMVAMGVAFPDFPKGLDFLCSIYCDGEPYYKDEGKKWYKNPFGSVLEFRRYSAMDAAVLPQVFAGVKRDLDSMGNWETYRRQLRLVEPLTYISARGIRMDVEGLKKASEAASVKIRELQAELNEIAGSELNPNSPQQIKTYFYILKKEKPYTKMGAATVDDTALTRLKIKGYREAGIILELRHLRKMKGTYYDVLLDKDNRLRCSWNPVGTKQGRVSSSKTIFDTGANLQNQPEEMLRLMLADPGYIMVKQDLSQAENRVVAFVSNEQSMIKAFDEGQDIHKHTAGLIYGVEPSIVTHDQRQMGKKSNHGLNYDMGYLRFALLHLIPNYEAKFIVERYHMIYPGIRQWHASIRQALASNRSLTNLYGRKRVFMDRWGDEMFKEAYSYIPQSTVADKLNQEGICDTYHSDVFKDVDILNNIHDALLYQVPLSLGIPSIIQIARKVQMVMEQPLIADGRSFSIPVDTSIGFNALDMLKLKPNEMRNDPLNCESKLQEFINAQAATRLD